MKRINFISQKMFDKEAKIYDRFYKGKAYEEEVELIRKYLSGKSVIDFGCGTGNHSVLLKQAGYRVVGVDPCYEMAVQAKAKGIPVRLWRNLTHKWWGIIVMFDVFNFIHDPERYADAFYNRLKPGGRLIVEVWNTKLKFRKYGIKFRNGILRLSKKTQYNGTVIVDFLYLPKFIRSKHFLRVYTEKDIRRIFKKFKLIKKIKGKSIIWIFEKCV